jgi:hypothetical protein
MSELIAQHATMGMVALVGRSTRRELTRIFADAERVVEHHSATRELDHLFSFTRKTSIVAELLRAREEWLIRGWDKICAPDAGSQPAVVDLGPEK